MTLDKMKQAWINKYLLLFFLVYLVVNLTASLIVSLLEVDRVPGLSSIILVVCAAYVAKNFINHEQRPPNKIEQRKLAWGTLAASFLVSICMIFIYAAFLGMDMQAYLTVFSELPIWLLSVLFIIVSGLYWLTLNYIFGSGAHRMAGDKER